MQDELKEEMKEFLEDIVYALDENLRIKILRALIQSNKPLSSQMIQSIAKIQMVEEAEMLDHLYELTRLGYIDYTNSIPKLYYITDVTRKIIKMYFEYKGQLSNNESRE